MPITPRSTENTGDIQSLDSSYQKEEGDWQKTEPQTDRTSKKTDATALSIFNQSRLGDPFTARELRFDSTAERKFGKVFKLPPANLMGTEPTQSQHEPNPLSTHSTAIKFPSFPRAPEQTPTPPTAIPSPRESDEEHPTRSRANAI